MIDNHHKSALNVQKGVAAPSSINPAFAKGRKRKTLALQSSEWYVKGILEGNRTILSMAITLVESLLEEHRKIAQQIIEQCLPYAGNSVRVGITGVPGVGKSTFIEAFGSYLTQQQNKRLAVLAIDPSSQRTKGSILGDKTRMEKLTHDEHAFIRPSPSAGSLGGVAQKTRESIILCEAAGFDVILVETVGVGQSEIAVHGMVDFFLLLMLAGAGDELQGIKRGIMEMADAIIINKADGDNKTKAALARQEYANALHLFPPAESGWAPQTHTCSAYTGEGIDNAWDMIQDYVSQTQDSGYFEHKRNEQNVMVLKDSVEHSLKNHFYNNALIRDMQKEITTTILEQKISAYKGAEMLMQAYLKGN